MSPISLTLLLIALLLFGVSAYLHLRNDVSSKAMQARFGLAIVAALCHGAGLWQLGNIGFYSSLSWVSAMMALFANIALRPSGERFLPALSVCIAVLCLLLTILLPNSTRTIGSWQIQVHAAVALMAYAFLSLAALQAILLLLQEHRLRTNKLSTGGWWPPLSRLERQLFQLIGVGFLLLSATLVTGVLFISDWFAQHLVHKTTLTIAAWLVYAGLLLAHWRLGLRGKQAAYACLGGMALLALAFFGSKFVLELLLKRTV